MVLVVVAALLAQTEAPVKLAVPGLSLAGVDAKLGEAWVERFATLLGTSPDLHVTTRRDIEQALGFERQKQLLGCADDSTSCLAELAGGLGVDALLSGSLAKAGSGYLVTLRVLRARDGAEVASASERLKDEDAVSEWFEDEAPRLAERIAVAFGRAKPAPRASHPERWIPGIVGGALVLGGAGLQLAARVDGGNLTAGSVPLDQVSAVVARGQTMETTSWVLIGAGAAGVAASVAWSLLAGTDGPQVAVVPIGGGAVVTLGGVLP